MFKDFASQRLWANCKRLPFVQDQVLKPRSFWVPALVSAVSGEDSAGWRGSQAQQTVVL